MTWHQFDGKSIELVQEKTGKKVWVPVHRELAAFLDKRDKTSVQICTKSYWTMSTNARKALKKAELDHLQIRDLRRTAMVRMAEAGAEDIHIAAVSGHSIQKTRAILETYIPRTRKMAEQAVLKWEKSENPPEKSENRL